MLMGKLGDKRTKFTVKFIQLWCMFNNSWCLTSFEYLKCWGKYSGGKVLSYLED